MARRWNYNSEPYNAYLSPNQTEQLRPKNAFFTTEFGASCGRHFCATCGAGHATRNCSATRLLEHVTGTTLPDAAFKASEADTIDACIQRRFQQERRKIRREHHCRPADQPPYPFNSRK